VVRALGTGLVVLFATFPCIGRQLSDTTQPFESYVTLELYFAEEAPITVTVRDGALATFEHTERAYSVGLIPRVADPSSGDVVVDVVAFTMRDGAPVSTRVLDTMSTKVGFRSSTAAASGQVLDLTVKGVSHAPPEWQKTCSPREIAAMTLSPSDSEAIEAENQSTGCCVSCGGITACGCAVSTSCGTCCNCSFC
jgi:hypothetical protein